MAGIRVKRTVTRALCNPSHGSGSSGFDKWEPWVLLNVVALARRNSMPGVQFHKSGPEGLLGGKGIEGEGESMGPNSTITRPF